MPDFLSIEERSKLMSKIRGKGTKPELLMEKILLDHGVKFDKHRTDLPGKPDFVIRTFKVVVFVDGEYWFKLWPKDAPNVLFGHEPNPAGFIPPHTTSLDGGCCFGQYLKCYDSRDGIVHYTSSREECTS